MKLLDRYCVVWLGVFLTAAALTCAADSITIDERPYTNVFIRQSEAMYYVQIPATGRVVSAFKRDVDQDTVRISPDPGHRAALLRQWRAWHAEQRPDEAGTPAEGRAPLARPAGDKARARRSNSGVSTTVTMVMTLYMRQ